MDKNLIILFKNYAEIDFLAPLVNEKVNKFDILVFDYSKEHIIKKNSLLEKFLIEKGVNIYEINDICKNRKLLKFISHKINNKLPSLKYNLWGIIKNFTLIKVLKNIFFKKIFFIIYNASKKSNNFHKYKNFLVGHRNLENSFLKIFENFFMKEMNNFIFIPHGPHYETSQTDEISNLVSLIILKKKNYLNLVANYYECPCKNNFNIKDNIRYYPYPLINYDRKKFKFLKEKLTNKKNILIILRSFSFIKNTKKNSFSVELDEILKLLNFANKYFGGEKNIYIKPHPTSDLELIKKIFKDNNFSNFYIFTDPMFLFTKKIDFAISFQSTVIFYLISQKIPVILYDCLSTLNYKMKINIIKYYNKAYYRAKSIEELEFFFKKFKKFDESILLKNQKIIKKVFNKKNKLNCAKKIF
jgi:hypothetical protein